MDPNQLSRTDPKADDAVDALIRRRFRACESMPLFPDPPRPPGFFQPSDIGPQLRLLDARPRGGNTGESR